MPHAPGRMLLAEANQWPEDTQQYFGDGDECHMAFHFPLMPRMYMAIAQEDRFPITDIMRQTPEIPPTCQWAVFLRNHDELTLEMVTDRERDYLWETYATDRRARLNLGIRRRLAPLLERDRRRIELMNGLLLSMPGTPVIYYGDEIGMGDNIHLGDRDGVRTPMQWSPDRNGGFSRADPARLVLPPIMDPLYGYPGGQRRGAGRPTRHSLLNWMRRMLAVRRRFSAFGRGTQRFLYPNNRKMLAYLREMTERPRRCCASAIFRARAQAVELDLAAFNGRVPVDMVGGSVFPPVGQLNYLLTLPPFGFFWFLLASRAHAAVVARSPPEALPEFTTIVVRRASTRRWHPRPRDPGARDAAELSGQAALVRRQERAARAACASSMRRRSRARRMSARRDRGHRRRSHRELRAPARHRLGRGDRGALAQQLALARVRRGRRVGVLTDAFAIDAFVPASPRCCAMARGSRFPAARSGSCRHPGSPPSTCRPMPRSAGCRPSSRTARSSSVTRWC